MKLASNEVSLKLDFTYVKNLQSIFMGQNKRNGIATECPKREREEEEAYRALSFSDTSFSHVLGNPASQR